MTRAVVFCLLAALLFGASTPVAKHLLGATGPFTLAGLFYLGAALGVAPFAFRGGSAALRRDPRHRSRLLWAVILGGIAGPVLLLSGLRLAPAASVSLWLNLETVATALLAAWWFHESMGRRAWIAVGLVMAGGVLLAAPDGQATVVAALLVAAATVCWGFDNNLTALVAGFTPAQTTLAKGAVAGVVNLALGLAFDAGSVPAMTAAQVMGALAVGALAYGASILLYIAGAQELGAGRSQLVFSSAPFLGMALAWVVLGEPVRGAQVAAAAFMATGIVLLIGERHGHEHAHEAVHHTHSHRHDDGHHDHGHPDLPVGVRHTHPHDHAPVTHAHTHLPDLHHRHAHD